MQPQTTSSWVWDVTKHIFAVIAAGKLSGLSSTFEWIGSSMNVSLGLKLYQAINNDDNRLHLIEVFREAVLWITTHFLFHPDRWLTSIWLLASLLSFTPLVHSNLCFILIPAMWLRSLSKSIAVDLMATEKIEDTDNLTGYDTGAAELVERVFVTL